METNRVLEKPPVALRRRLLLEHVAELHLPDVHGENRGEEEGLQEEVREKAHDGDAAKLLKEDPKTVSVSFPSPSSHTCLLFTCWPHRWR